MSNPDIHEQDQDFFSDTGEHFFDIDSLMEVEDLQEIEVENPRTKSVFTVPQDIVLGIARNLLSVPGSKDLSNPAHDAVAKILEERGITIPESATSPDAAPVDFYQDSIPTQSSQAAEA